MELRIKIDSEIDPDSIRATLYCFWVCPFKKFVPIPVEDLNYMLEGSDLPHTLPSDGAIALFIHGKSYHVNGLVAGHDHDIAKKIKIDRGTLKKHLPELERLHLAKRLTMEFEGIRIPAIRFSAADDLYRLMEGAPIRKADLKRLTGSFCGIKKDLRQLRTLYSLNGQLHRMTSKKRKSEDLPMIVINPKKLSHINKVSRSTVKRDIEDLKKQDLIRTETIDRYIHSKDIDWSMLIELRKRGLCVIMNKLAKKGLVRISLGTVVTHLISMSNEYDLYVEPAYVRSLREKLVEENLWYWFGLEKPMKSYKFYEALKAL